MPELPEVEVTRLSFADAITGAHIHSAWQGKPLRWPLGVAVDSLQGRRVAVVRRRGKYILMDLDDGLLLWHLGMSGSLLFQPTLPPRGVHDHFELHTSHGTLRLNDPRRFGAVVHAPSEASPEAQLLLGHLGVEPLSDAFDVVSFRAALKQRHAPIKQVLLSGQPVVGVGNIYACEALFMARIRPTLAASKLTGPQVQRLHAAIVQVLNTALHSGGSTLRNFSSAVGKAGYFQLQTQVYDREGLPCRVCGTPIKRRVQGQRSTFYCPQCQK